MKKLWKFLQGKKTSIGTISGAIIYLLAQENVISSDLGFCLQTILVGLGLGANIGNAVIAKKNEANSASDK